MEAKPSSSLVVSYTKPTRSLVVFLDKALNRIASTFKWLDGNNRRQLDSKTEKTPLLSPPSRGTSINEQFFYGFVLKFQMGNRQPLSFSRR